MSTNNFKRVERDKAVFNERENETILRDRDGADLLEMYHADVFDLLTKGTCEKNAMSAYIKEGIKKLGDNSLVTINRMVKDTADYFANDNCDAEFIEYRLSKRLFPWQKIVMQSTAKKITMLCGRRTGKSWVEAFLAVNHCTAGYDDFNGFRKARHVAIIGLTVEKSAEIFWQNVKDAAELSTMKYKVDNSKYKITFKNGATIQLFGNNNKQEREKVRGTEFSLIIIDEAQSQNALHYLLTDIFGPIIKGRDSTVILSGTGSLTGYGTWVDICSDPKWQHFHYTMSDNPSVPLNALQEILEENHWTEDNITYQREYLANHVIDTTRMIVPKWHSVEKIPEGFICTQCYIGLDYGWSDYTALVPIVFDKDGHGFVLKCDKFRHTETNDIANKCKALVEELSNTFKVKPLVIADNSHQMISATIARLGVQIYNAVKHDATTGLRQQIVDASAAIQNGTLEIVGCEDLLEDFKNFVWKWDDEKKCVIYEEDSEYYHPDLFHALRYAYCTYKTKYRK